MIERGIIDLAEWEAKRADGFALAPFVDWTKFSSFDDYYNLILSRNRGLVREYERRGRSLKKHLGETLFAEHDEGDDVIALAQQWKKTQLRAMGENDIFSCDKNVRFFYSMAEKGLLKASTLRAGKDLLSVWLGFVYDGVWSGWIFASNPDLGKYSLGHQLLQEMLKKSYALGHRQFDFSLGDEGYKFMYATDGRILGPIGDLPLRDRLLEFAKKNSRKHPRLKMTIEKMALDPLVKLKRRFNYG